MTSPLSHCAVHTMQRVSKTYCSLTGLPYQTNQPASQPGGAPRRCSHNKTTEYVVNSQSRWVAENRVSSESRERESNTSNGNNIRVRIRSWLSAGARLLRLAGSATNRSRNRNRIRIRTDVRVPRVRRVSFRLNGTIWKFQVDCSLLCRIGGGDGREYLKGNRLRAGSSRKQNFESKRSPHKPSAVCESEI